MENNLASIFCDINKHSIPLDPANSDYQRVLDDIIEQGADCFEVIFQRNYKLPQMQNNSHNR